MENIHVFCPFCGSKTKTQIRTETVLEKFPLYCQRCKRESIVTARNGKIIKVEEPDATTQSR